MESFLSLLVDNHVAVIANLGLLGLAAWVISFFSLVKTAERWRLRTRSEVRLGVLFGLFAAMLMYVPIPLEPGIFADARGAPILMSGIAGGPVAALITGAVAIANRLWIGGAGAATGVAYIAVFAAMGAAWRYHRVRFRRRPTAVLDMVLYSAVVMILTTPAVLLLPADIRMDVLLELWPKMGAVTILGATILGFLMRRDLQTQELIAALEQQRRSAEQGQRAKSTFLANMSHELRTPLNAILGFSEIIAKDQLRCGIDAKYKTYAEDILQSGQHLLSLLNDILDLSKIEAGKYEMAPRTLKMAEIWALPLANSKVLARRKKITLATDDIDPDATIYGDLRGIQQCLLNVIGNAIKYTPDDGTVTCRAKLHGRFAEFVVEDTGPGIPPEDMERVLQPFEQTRGGSRGEKPTGTGLGLSITQSLLQLMGGTLEIQSQTAEAGRTSGTIVTMVMPINKEDGTVAGSFPPNRN